MKVTNSTGEAIIAFGIHVQCGYGEDVRIEPGRDEDVSGPYLGEMDGGKCYVHIEGKIVCHDKPDNGTSFQVTKGNPLCLKMGNLGVTVRHHDDEPEPQVMEWRMMNHCTPLVPETSYCLDVTVGYSERNRDELIDFLRRTGQPFEIAKVQRGMWMGTKILRIETPKARALQQHIWDGLFSGDDNGYIVHETYIDAQRSDTWLPDYDYGYEPFSLNETAGA